MDLKQDSVHFALSPKQGNKIEGVCKQSMYFGILLLLNEGQGFKPRENERFKYWSSTSPPTLGITMDKERSLTNNDETISTLVCVRGGYSRQYSRLD